MSLRLLDGIRSLRRRGRHELVERALEGVLGRAGFAVVHYTILSNHVHLVTEAEDRASLARGIQSLAIRIAKAVNRADGRRGPVFRDRYHVHVLRTPAEVRHALCYVLQNFRRHATNAGGIVDPEWLDPLSSADAFDGWRGRDGPQELPPRTARPTSWLVTIGWRRHGLIAIDEVPAAAWA